jgi:hypothetical protein
MTANGDYRAWFRETFGAELPIALRHPVERVGEQVWGSPGAPQPPMIPPELVRDGDYVLTGLWGHGVQSWAFYLVDVGPRFRCFFRMSFGGAYGDSSEDTRDILAWLAAWERFRAAAEAKGAGGDIVHDMGTSEAELTTAGGETVALRSPPEFGVPLESFFEELAAALR